MYPINNVHLTSVQFWQAWMMASMWRALGKALYKAKAFYYKINTLSKCADTVFDSDAKNHTHAFIYTTTICFCLMTNFSWVFFISENITKRNKS